MVEGERDVYTGRDIGKNFLVTLYALGSSGNAEWNFWEDCQNQS